MNHALATTGAEGVEIFMSAPLVTARPQRGTLGDLAAMWVALFAALAYLDVPLRNAPLFAIALVLQASLGALVITRLLDGLQPSLLLLCGPGLILGGALSFAVFQIVGRGATGVVATTLIGIAAAGNLSVRGQRVKDLPRLWMLGQLFGLATTVMMNEFTELLPIAILLCLVGFLLSPHKPIHRWVLPASAVAITITAAATMMNRQEYWWVVTDDYQLFEVLTKHITLSGPLTDWGSASFARYHWLSYGWSGLLDFLGGGPAPFVTLTRVMPLIYSLALAASLVLICHHAHEKNPVMSNLLPVWAVAAITELDWSGTSTAGVYSVLATTAYVLLRITTSQQLKPRGLLLLAVCTSTLILTKMPSSFVILAVGLAVTTIIIADNFRGKLLRSAVLLVGLVITICTTASLIWLIGKLFGWRFDLFDLNYGLGQLSETTKPFAIVALVLLRLPLWILLVFTVIDYRHEADNAGQKKRFAQLTSLACLALGIVLESSIFSHSNVYLYLASPFYFVASLSLITLHNSRSSGVLPNPKKSQSLTLTAFVILLGMFWTGRFGSQTLWRIVDSLAPGLPDLYIALLQFVTMNSRVGAALIAAPIAVLLLLVRSRQRLTQLLLVPLVVLSFTNLSLSSFNSFRIAVSRDEIVMSLGSAEIRAIAEELARVSTPSDLIATNHLVDNNRNLLSDFSLAAWSRREFLILGPAFLGDLDPRQKIAFARSMAFADSPSATICKRLWDEGVRWFVVDLRVSSSRDWSACSDTEMSTDNYVLLSLRMTSLR